MKNSYSIVCLCFSFMLFSCDGEKIKSSNKGKKNLSDTKTSATDNEGLVQQDPKFAKVLSLLGPNLENASENSKLKVPTIRFNIADKTNGVPAADYLQILRCVKGTELKVSTGEDIKSIPEDKANRLELLQSAWNILLADIGKCYLVGESISRDNYQDLAANSGDFFYVVNPCYMTERSLKKNEMCSYNLKITSPITYTSSLEKNFFDAAKDVASAESELTAVYNRLYYLNSIIRSQQESCENQYATSQASKDFWKGVGSLAAAAVGATVGALVSGGTAAVQGAQTGLSIGVAFFGGYKNNNAPLICPLVDEKIAESAQAATKIEPAVAKVLAARKKLSDINSEYERLDEIIYKSTTSGSKQ